MQKEELKRKIKKIVDDCSQELSKATVIGKKMITASQMNSCLNEKYLELGRITAKDLKLGVLKYENCHIEELLKEIEECEEHLRRFESDVSEIKSSD